MKWLIVQVYLALRELRIDGTEVDEKTYELLTSHRVASGS